MGLFSRIQIIVGKFERVAAVFESIADSLLAQLGDDANVAVAVVAAPAVNVDAKLRELLSNAKYRFRKLSTLAAAIGRTEAETVDILKLNGARPAKGNDTLWTLDAGQTQVTGATACAKLREMLNHPDYKFRKLSTLAAAIGATGRETISILEEIGARPARGNDSLWCLEDDHDCDDDDTDDFDDDDDYDDE